MMHEQEPKVRAEEEKPPYAEDHAYEKMSSLWEQNNFAEVFGAIERVVDENPMLFTDGEFLRYYNYYKQVFAETQTFDGNDYVMFKERIMAPFWNQLYEVGDTRPRVRFSGE